MKRVLIYLLVASAGIASTSCKKDTVAATPAPTKTELLTAKSWRISGDVTVSTTSGRVTTTDNFATASPCEKDDFLKFSTDKKVIIDQGPLKCQGTNQTETGVWDFNSDQTKLTLGAPGTSTIGQFDIPELSATTLKLSQTDTSNGTTEVKTTTFTAF